MPEGGTGTDEPTDLSILSLRLREQLPLGLMRYAGARTATIEEIATMTVVPPGRNVDSQRCRSYDAEDCYALHER